MSDKQVTDIGHAPFATLRDAGGQLAAFGARDAADVVKATLDRVDEALTAWWNHPLTLRAAEAWGGYSLSQLRRLIADGTVPVAPDGRIRRRDVPIRPGHPLPIGIEPAPSARPDWTESLRERRQHGLAS